jgi:hypothetical protein
VTKVKRILALGAAVGAVAAWWAAASTATPPRSSDNLVRKTTPVEMRGAELAAEIARLRERLHPTVAPQTPSRNLFEFAARQSAPGPAAAAPAAAAVEVPTSVITPPPLKLVGIAEDEGPEGAIRTAIVSSSSGELFFAKPGDRLADRYLIAKISSEAAEVTDLANDSTFTLILK